MTGIAITLIPQRIKFCDEAALARRGNAVTTGLQPHNRAPTEHEAALRIDRIGLYGEAAGMIYLSPCTWHFFKPGRSALALPDINDWIDVKTRSKSWHDLIVQKDDPSDWAYLLAHAESFPTIFLIGWCWGHEAKMSKLSDPAGGRPAHFIKQSSPILKAPSTLRKVKKERDGE